ncbi:MAG: TlpA family protein disulfide reductase, partial [Bacteroidales bacterium]|nr:TlpA family protein disulfide reductase [Bacteroidales bacterium]
DVNYAQIPDLSEISHDTLLSANGKLVWNHEITQPTEVRMALSQYGDYPISFWICPGEKAKMEIKWEDDDLHYNLSGSEQLAAQSRLYAVARDANREMQQVRAQISKAMERGVEYADEQFVDSLSALYRLAQAAFSDVYMDYVKTYPDDARSAIYLMRHPVKDTFLAYYETLGEKVREGVMKENLDDAKQKAERLRELDANALSARKGEVAPDFEMTDVQGNTFRLSDFKDKYVVLDFWGTWCPWCVKGLPRMKAYHKKYASKVEFIGISNRDKAEKLQEFLQQENIKWRNAQNAEEGNPDVVLMYGVSGYPTKIFLAPGLVVKGRYLGEVEEFYNELDKIR